MPVERREWVIAIGVGSTGNGRNPTINGGRRPSCGDTSRMNREVHVRLCVQERLACSAGDKPAGAKVRRPVVRIAGWRETSDRSAENTYHRYRPAQLFRQCPARSAVGEGGEAG